MKTISHKQYLQVEGLLALGRRHVRQVAEIELAVMDIVGESEQGGHSGDALWEDYPAKRLLDNLKISVSPESKVGAE